MGSVTSGPSVAIASLTFSRWGKMINSLDTYLQSGFSNIFLVGGGPKSEEDNWHQTEKSTEIAVARKGTEFVRATCAVTFEICPGVWLMFVYGLLCVYGGRVGGLNSQSSPPGHAPPHNCACWCSGESRFHFGLADCTVGTTQPSPPLKLPLHSTFPQDFQEIESEPNHPFSCHVLVPFLCTMQINYARATPSASVVAVDRCKSAS